MKRKRKGALLVPLLLICSLGCQTVPPEPEEKSDKSTNEAVIIGSQFIWFYRQFISTQDEPTCIFEPSCSEYMEQAIRMYGFTGFFMGVDRLSRCHPANSQFSDQYLVLPNGKLYDPPRKPQP